MIGQKSDISFEDLGKLEYCTWVFKETLRLYPPSTMTFRELTHDHPIDGYQVPKGSVIVVSVLDQKLLLILSSLCHLHIGHVKNQASQKL